MRLADGRRGTGAWLGAIVLLGLTSCGDSPPPVPQANFDTATMQRLLEGIDRLVAATQTAPRSVRAAVEPSTTGPERVAVASESDDLRARIEALEQELAMLRTRGGSAYAAPRSALPPPMQPQAVQQFASQVGGQDEAAQREARRSVFLLDQQQVLHRFGMPTWTGVPTNGSVNWGYSDGTAGFSVVFVNGLVTVIDG